MEFRYLQQPAGLPVAPCSGKGSANPAGPLMEFRYLQQPAGLRSRPLQRERLG